MTLVNRVSAFFLTALGVALAGYSVVLFVLVREHLYGEFDQRLHGALRVLVAAVEVEPEDVKWQPSDHAVAIGGEGEADEVRWVIADDRGRVVDHSRNLSSAAAAERARQSVPDLDATGDAVAEVGTWRLLRRRLAASSSEEPDDRDSEERESDEFSELVVTVAQDSSPLRATLWQLGLLTCGLSAALWLVAASVGRAYCRRALRPLMAMAAQARATTGPDFAARLPVPAHRDELADLATAFNGLLDKQQQAFERQRRFTGDAAHQLRTPLTVLRGQVDVALRRPRTADEYRRVLEVLQEQTAELQQVVELLLFLARAEEDAELPDRQEVSLADWLAEYLLRWREHPRAADLVLRAGPDVRADVSPSLLGQLLDNLIGNALKYSAAGTPVSVSVARHNGEVALSVEDRGEGVGPEEREAVFQPFYRSPRARQSGTTGTGLGLAIAARIAESLHGRLECESELGAGSRFTLRLP